MKNKIIFKKVTKIHIDQIIVLFNQVFGINISKKFYNWRYFNQKLKSYTSFVAVDNKKIIGHVGYFINNFDLQPYLASRHTSMIDDNFRSKNIYSNLLFFSFKIIREEFKTKNILIWPNENNLRVLKKICKNPIIYEYNIYFKTIKNKGINNFISKKIDVCNYFNFKTIKKKIKSNKFLFNKNIFFLKWRYQKYCKKEYKYFIIYKELNEPKSIFVIKEEINNKVLSCIILDYICYDKYSFKNDLKLLLNNNKILFKNKTNNEIIIKLWSNIKNIYFKKFLRNEKFSLDNSKRYYLSYLNIKKNSIQSKKIINNRNVFMGDTDNFININD